ncbi:MAG: ACT domain-containing protein, partial [Anaerovoracaceae bacterium]
SLPPEERQRFIEVEWDSSKASAYDADITVVSEDRKGLFSDLTKVCESMDVHIAGVNAKCGKDETITVVLTVSITDTAQMAKLLSTVRSVSGIVEVYRSKT